MTNVAKIKLYQSDIFKKSTVKVYSKITKQSIIMDLKS